MKTSLLVQIREKALGGADQTVIFDYAPVVREAEITSNRLDAPGKMVFTCLKANSAHIQEGSTVEFKIGETKIFKGYIFTVVYCQADNVIYTAYDQLRYLKAKASYVFENMSLSQIIQRIAADFGLTTGILEETVDVFHCLIL